VRSDFSKTLS